MKPLPHLYTAQLSSGLDGYATVAAAALPGIAQRSGRVRRSALGSAGGDMENERNVH